MNTSKSKQFYRTSDGHEIFYDHSGHLSGPTILFIHGGPGLGTTENDLAFFDLSTVNVIRFDQRGSGKSLPSGELSNNTTQHLISDIIGLLNYLKVDKVILFGGSWGSTLSLLFGILHPEKVLGMVLRGIFTATKKERQFFEYGGTRLFRPEVWDSYAKHIPNNELKHGSAYYYEQILCGDPESIKKLAYAFSVYGLALSTMEELGQEEIHSMVKQSNYQIRARILAHYSVHDFFLNEGYILNNIEQLRYMPISIVQGKFDLITPPEIAIRIASFLPNVTLRLIDGGHASTETTMANALRREVETLTKQLN